MGLYQNVNAADLHKMFKDMHRIELLTDVIWLNGGMPFNIQIRLDNHKVLLLDNYPSVYAEHLTKVTGFFAARKLMKYVDSPEEVEVWRARFLELYKADAPSGTLYMDPGLDRKFLLRLAKRLEKESIEDPLLNTQIIERISSKP